MSTTKALFVIFFIITILSDELQGRPEVDWFSSIYTRLCDSHDVHTAVIVHYHDTDNSDGVKDELFGRIIGSMPTVIVEMDDEGIQLEASDFGDVSKLSTFLLFIFYAAYSKGNELIYKVMHSINELADFSVNYLLMILKSSSDTTRGIEDILQNAWKESMLNFAIVEIRPVPNFNRSRHVFVDGQKFLYCKNAKCSRVHSIINHDNSSKVIIHQFNPFSNKTYHQKFSAGIEFFPNFAKNMHGYRLNVLVVDQPPFSLVEWDENNRMKKMSGPDIVLMQTLAKMLNFSHAIAPRMLGDKLRPKNSTLQDLVRRFKTLNVDISAHLGARTMDDIFEESMRSRNILRMELGVLMPKKYEMNRTILRNALTSSALILVTIIIIWFVVTLLKFDAEIWQLQRIFGLIFKTVVPHRPTRIHERILFWFVAMLGFMYSNDIYASLTNLGIDHLVEYKYDTFERIDDSGLTPLAQSARKIGIFRNVVGDKLSLGKKIMKAPMPYCLQMAMVHCNVCCVLHRGHVDGFYEEWSDSKNEQYPLRFAEPTVGSDDRSFYFRPDVPCKEDINRVIDRCEETGLLDKWYSKGIDSSKRTTQANDHAQLRDTMLKSHLLGQLLVVMVFGNSVAVLVFITELLTNRFRNNSKGNLKIN